MSLLSFFDEPSNQSKVKSEIVAQYFWSWAKVVINKVRPRPERIAYIDLYPDGGSVSRGSIRYFMMVIMGEVLKDARHR